MGKHCIASGHPETSAAAAAILKAGGNAFDAVVAAGFASSVAEPALTSLGGGGHALLSPVAQKPVLFDFFCDTPGLGRGPDQPPPQMDAVTIHFPGTDQEFHIGPGSVAVPGVLKGLLHLHARFGRMSRHDVIAPALALLEGGALVSPYQASLLALLEPILMSSASSRALYAPAGHLVKGGERMVLPELVTFLQEVADHGDAVFYEGALAQRMTNDVQEAGGLLNVTDLKTYSVVEREPLQIEYGSHQLLTNPAPSFGGGLIALSLTLLQNAAIEGTSFHDPSHVTGLLATMEEVERLRAQGIQCPADLDADQNRLCTERVHRFSRGTTHVTVADSAGNVASMTTSNGEGSGYVVPGTGVMLNNMMGEDDLHPEGFHSAPPGKRVASTMSPTLLKKADKCVLALGSGGSKRIRTAILQVISAVVDHGLSLHDAVAAPRVHWDGSTAQVEPGFSPASVDALRKHWPVNVWDQPDLYFGGVHAVIPGRHAEGDFRRGGAALEVEDT